ncbi:nuclear transport factor 2 family protein [Spirosoma aureum]|uniref:Nuclear transport factor 2 family protein n=1 Tax=Spirosoma aureum TaxID=2692134 RepID=A0A6G9AQ56_9BACT|nr:nuclear transport factor 2 family protein [Spirosoma aureum]QIP14540.1 nuclear transport factor 2 family protein [Spirosoma aureum]
MIQFRWIILFVTVTILKSAGLFAQSDLKADEKTIAFLKQFRSDFSRSMLEKNPSLIQAYYAETIRLMPEYQKTIMGKRNALLYHNSFATRFAVQEFRMNELEVNDLGSMVAEIGLFTLKMNEKRTGKAFDLKGKYVNIWEKAANGTILLMTDAWNYNHPLEIDDQLTFKEIPVVDVAVQAHMPITNNISFELAALNRLMEATVSQHDHRIWSQFYAEDGMFCYTGHPIYKGKKELDAFLVEHCKGLPIFEKLDIRNDRIDHLGTYVIEYASHIATVRNGDWSGVGVGKDLRIWRREKDGSLKLFRHIGMYD